MINTIRKQKTTQLKFLLRSVLVIEDLFQYSGNYFMNLGSYTLYTVIASVKILCRQLIASEFCDARIFTIRAIISMNLGRFYFPTIHCSGKCGNNFPYYE